MFDSLVIGMIVLSLCVCRLVIIFGSVLLYDMLYMLMWLVD